MELRWGYSTISASTVNVSAITALIPYTLWTGTKYVIRVQGTTPYQVAVADGTVTSPTVRGAAFGSSAKGSYYTFNNHLHYGNGTDQKWFDGTTWRNNGLRALTATEIANVVVATGIQEQTAAQNSTITLTAAAGGSFAATTGSGMLFYVALFDTAANELGPATTSAGSGRVTVTASQKVTVANMPDYSATQPTVVKLIARTGDTTAAANFCTNTSTAITSCSRTSTTLTVISPTHGLSTGDIVVLSGTTNFDSVYSITVTDVNTFTATLFVAVGQSTSGANTTGGTCKRIIKAAAATTSIDVLAPTQDTSILVNDANRGLALSASGLAGPGYQFYASIYNPGGGGHVGNRIAIGGGKITRSDTRFNVRITGLPDLSGTDSEWSLILGRTGDGAQVPYLSADSNGNFFFTASGQTAITLTTQGALGQSLAGQGVELPNRNGIIPAACDKFAVVGDYIYAADSVSPTIRRSASQVNAKSAGFAGKPEQSFAPDDIDTFPTNEGPSALAEIDSETWVATLNDCAILTDASGILFWRGPWTVGCAGKRAFTKTDHGFFWLTGEKQLATFINGVPIAISDEYEKAELAQIGDSQLSAVELTYFRDAQKGLDVIRVEGQKSDGTPHTVVHDFLLKDGRSLFGQGYGAEFLGPLATAFTIAKVRDANGHRQIWAGASNGQMYQLYSGANDAGTEYSADAIQLVNAGAVRIDAPFIDWYGDQNVIISVAQTLKADTSANAQFGFTPLTSYAAPDFDNMFRFRANLSIPQVTKVYVRFQLTSHSADGSLALNTIPHIPLETYGQIYEVIPMVGQQRP